MMKFEDRIYGNNFLNYKVKKLFPLSIKMKLCIKHKKNPNIKIFKEDLDNIERLNNIHNFKFIGYLDVLKDDDVEELITRYQVEPEDIQTLFNVFIIKLSEIIDIDEEFNDIEDKYIDENMIKKEYFEEVELMIARSIYKKMNKNKKSVDMLSRWFYTELGFLIDYDFSFNNPGVIKLNDSVDDILFGITPFGFSYYYENGMKNKGGNKNG